MAIRHVEARFMYSWDGISLVTDTVVGKKLTYKAENTVPDIPMATLPSNSE